MPSPAIATGTRSRSYPSTELVRTSRRAGFTQRDQSLVLMHWDAVRPSTIRRGCSCIGFCLPLAYPCAKFHQK